MRLAEKSVFRLSNCKERKINYGDLRLSEPSVTSLGIAASGKYIAAGYGDHGNVAILPTKAEQYTRGGTVSTVSAHGAALADFTFGPFSDSQLATAGKDGVIKVFTLPDNVLTSPISKPDVAFSDFDGPNTLSYHPSAEGVLAVGGKKGLTIYDLANSAEKYSFLSESGKDIISIGWSWQGNMIGGVGKNGVFHCFDPRQEAKDIFG